MTKSNAVKLSLILLILFNAYIAGLAFDTLNPYYATMFCLGLMVAVASGLHIGKMASRMGFTKMEEATTLWQWLKSLNQTIDQVVK